LYGQTVNGVPVIITGTTTVNGQTCNLGSSCTITASPSGIVSEALGGTGTNNTPGAAGHILRSNGSHYIDSAIQSADVPPIIAYTVTTDSSTARTLSANDNATIILFTSSSTITVTVPAGLGAGYNVIIEQGGTGVINFTGSGTTLHQLIGFPSTNGQWAKVLLTSDSDTSWGLSGNLLGTVTRTIGCAVGDPAGSALATGILCYVPVPTSCTISSWDIKVDSGTATVDIWQTGSSTTLPTISNTITASAIPAIASNTMINSTTTTGWATSNGGLILLAKDTLAFNLKTTSGPKYVYAGIRCE
jgi:hypothetical protein